MKKTLSIVVGVVALVIIIGGVYVVSQPAPPPVSDVGDSEAVVIERSSDPKNATYSIGGESVTLVDGRAEQAAAPGAAAMVVTQYFGNEVRTDLNNDGREDVVFLLTQNTGGTGTFYYAVAALDTENGWMGSEGFYVGDRIAPQTTEISSNPDHRQVVVINYAERAPDQAMTEAPSVGKSVWLKLDVDTMTFGEVLQDFEGEANPEIMTLDMKPWTWVKTTYNNDTELVPQQADAFTLTFTNAGSVSATTDCNAMSGTYAVTENQISFGPMAATRMFCQDSQEQEFAAMLAETQSFFFTTKGELVLELKLDSGSALFR
jgi:heat shock protein HslJ